MRKLFLFLISFLIGALIFFWVVKIVGWTEITRAFFVFSFSKWFAILTLSFLAFLSWVWKWKEVLKSQGFSVPFRNLFKANLAGFTINFFLPMTIFGGDAFRAYVLKEQNAICWTKGMASAFIDRILDYTANLVVIILAVLFFILKVGFLPKKLELTIGITLLLFTLGIFFFYFKSFKKESIAKFFLQIFKPKYNEDSAPFRLEKEIFSFFGLKKRAMWKGIGLAFLKEILLIFRTWLLIIFFGKKIGFTLAVVTYSFSYLAYLIPIPMALGTHEATQAFVFGVLDLGTEFGPVYTMLIRTIDIILALIGAAIFFWLTVKLKHTILLKKLKKLVKST